MAWVAAAYLPVPAGAGQARRCVAINTLASVRMGGPAKSGGESSSSRWEHLEAQPAAVRAHAVIGAEDAEIGQRLSQEQGAGEVQPSVPTRVRQRGGDSLL